MNKINNEQNRNRGIDTWNRLTTGRGVGGGWMKELAEEHICMTQGCGQCVGDCLRQGGSWMEVGKGGKCGDNCNSINIKYNLKNKGSIAKISFIICKFNKIL